MRLIKRYLKPLVPLRLRIWLRQKIGWRWFRGNYGSWAEAKTAAGGYDHPAILARVLAATREVRAGRASWERDGTVFMEPCAHAPLLGALQSIVAEEDGVLEVVDFGGALGSAWWQHRAYLNGVARVRWRVVEQPAYVAAGRAEFTDEVLSFHATLDEAGPAPVILISGVLQYLELPHVMIREVAARGYRHVIIDRTGFIRPGKGDRLTVQHTPPAPGGGSYACWLFDRDSLLAPLLQDYDLAGEWPVAFDWVDGTADFRGFHFRRRPVIGAKA